MNRVDWGGALHQFGGAGKRLECASPRPPFLQLTATGCREAEGSLQARVPSMGKGPEAGGILKEGRKGRVLGRGRMQSEGSLVGEEAGRWAAGPVYEESAFVQDHWKAMKDFQQINDRVKLKH